MPKKVEIVRQHDSNNITQQLLVTRGPTIDLKCRDIRYQSYQFKLFMFSLYIPIYRVSFCTTVNFNNYFTLFLLVLLLLLFLKSFLLVHCQMQYL